MKTRHGGCTAGVKNLPPPHLGKALLVDVIHHNNLVVEAGRRSSRAERESASELGAERYAVMLQGSSAALKRYLRLRERGRMAVARRHSSPEMLSVQKCLERKCSSSGVGWKGSWCSFSCDEQDDWK